MTTVLALARGDIADFVSSLVLVYTILIFVYIVSSLIFSMGARVPYSRASNVALSFLRDVCEPYLALFRRFIPPIGPLDLSPLVAVLVLQIVVGGILVPLIR